MGLSPSASSRGFAVAYPDGIDGVWNVGREVEVNRPGHGPIDDVAFIEDLVTHLVSHGVADPRKVVVLGVSNGGMMAMRLACERTTRFAGIGAIVAHMPRPLLGSCAPQAGLTVLLVAGTKDTLMPWEGGRVVPMGMRDRGEVVSANDTAAFWRRANGCTEEPVVVQLPDRSPDDGTRVWLSLSERCARFGGRVIACRVEGGGHTIPGRPYPPGVISRLSGATTFDVAIDELVWAAFDRSD